MPAMALVRRAAEGLEAVVADDLWPLPTYQVMLYSSDFRLLGTSKGNLAALRQPRGHGKRRLLARAVSHRRNNRATARKWTLRIFANYRGR